MYNAAVATGIPVLAHQGGWDEMLLVAGPILVVVGLLALARRRVTRTTAADPTEVRDPRPEDPHDRFGPRPQ